jgi:L-iditol 2-dehydrogenase
VKAAVLHGPNDLRYEEIETPSPGSGEVLVRVGAVGVCGSDIPRVLGNAAHYYPIVLGHEFAGEVVAAGPDVPEDLIGRRAAAAPLVPCLSCTDCQRGDYSLCEHYTFVGSRLFGAFAEYVRVPARNLVPLDEGTDDVAGAFFEPSTVALHGLRVAGFRPGEHVAILGAGTVGSFAVQWARLLGARCVTVVDVDDTRLALARRLGADLTVNSAGPGSGDSAAGAVERALAATGGRGYGFVIETAGRNAAMAMSFRLVAGRGTVCNIGTESADLAFGHELFELLNRKEFTLTGSWMSYSAPFPGDEWTMTAEYFADGRLRLDEGLLHGTYPLSAAAEAFEMFATPGKVKGKVMLVPDEITA